MQNKKPEITSAIAKAVGVTRLFRDLKSDSEPNEPLPEDSLAESLAYTQHFEPKCVICNSPFRSRAEHIFLENGRKVMPVINFFAYYFNAKLNHTQVATHMENHCTFRGITTSGLKNYELREEDIAPWRYRELELALTALLVELDDIRGMDCSKNNDMKLKRGALVERLASKIVDIKSKRDEAAQHSVNIFQVLSEIHDSMKLDTDKQVIRDKVKEIRNKLTQETTANA